MLGRIEGIDNISSPWSRWVVEAQMLILFVRLWTRGRTIGVIKPQAQFAAG